MTKNTQVKDRTTCSCTGFALASYDGRKTDGDHTGEYRIREWAYHRFWQLQELKQGATGSAEDDYIDLGQFPTKDAALAFIGANRH